MNPRRKVFDEENHKNIYFYFIDNQSLPFRPACRLGMGKGKKRLIIKRFLFGKG